MISELVKKDFTYTKRVNFLFVIIVMVLSFFSLAISSVSYTHMERVLHHENESFVHNIATFYLEQHLKPFELALNEISELLDRNEVENFIDGNESAVQKKLMAMLSVMPTAASIIIARRDGSINTVPEYYSSKNIDATARPWFTNVSGSVSVVTYTDLYKDVLDQLNSLTISKSLLDDKGEQFGVLAMDMNLVSMSYPLRQLKSPSQGRFMIVDRLGKSLINSDTNSIGLSVIPQDIMARMTSGMGKVYDADDRRFYYYYSYSNPDWFVVLIVDEADIKVFTLYDSKIILVAFLSCVAIYLMLWFFMNQSIKNMIVDIVSLMRFGRIDKNGEAAKQIVEEILENNNQIQVAR